MSKKILWTVMSGVMVLFLVMASCNAPAAIENQTTTATSEATTAAGSDVMSPVAPTSQPVQSEPAAPEVKEPIYGGTYTRTAASDPTGGWDPTVTQAIRVSHMQLTSNELMQGDWTKGPQGTGETSWQYGYLGDISLETGGLTYKSILVS